MVKNRKLYKRCLIKLQKENGPKYEGYLARVHWTSSKPFNPLHEVVDVRMTTRDGQELTANFITRSYLDFLFAKNRRTGECAQGTYFAMPGMIVVDEISDQTIKATIDDLIKNSSVPYYFTEIDSD